MVQILIVSSIGTCFRKPSTCCYINVNIPDRHLSTVHARMRQNNCKYRRLASPFLHCSAEWCIRSRLPL